jgi:hypothetical protein
VHRLCIEAGLLTRAQLAPNPYRCVGCHDQFFLAENVDTLIESSRAAFHKRGVPPSS